MYKKIISKANVSYINLTHQQCNIVNLKSKNNDDLSIIKYYNSENIWFNKNVIFPKFEKGVTSFHFLKNIFPIERNGSDTQIFNSTIIDTSLNNQSTHFIWSPIKKIVNYFGLKLNGNTKQIQDPKNSRNQITVPNGVTNFIYIDIDNYKYYYNGIVGDIYFLNTAQLPEFTTEKFDNTHFIYQSNILKRLPFNPNHHRILYPLSINNYGRLYYYFELQNNNSITIPSPSPIDYNGNITIDRFKMMFQHPEKQTYYTYGTNGFVQVGISGIDPTYDDFQKNAITYQQYLNIKNEEFNNTFGDVNYIHAIINGYEPPIYILHSALQLDVGQTMDLTSTAAKRVFRKMPI